MGAQARFDRANSSNEIPGGRKINFLGLRDDGSDPSKNRDEGTKLVQEDQIFAAVPVITPFLGASDFLAVDSGTPDRSRNANQGAELCAVASLSGCANRSSLPKHETAASRSC